VTAKKKYTASDPVFFFDTELDESGINICLDRLGQNFFSDSDPQDPENWMKGLSEYFRSAGHAVRVA